MRRIFTLTVVRRRTWVCLCVLAWVGCSTLLSAASRCEPETLLSVETSLITGVSPEHATDEFTGTLPTRQISSLDYQAILLTLPEPVLPGMEQEVLQWNYTDDYQAIDCAVDGFVGPFAPKNWKKLEEKGDGGVDVTGALDVLLVEGANKARLEAVPERSTIVSIVVPVGGYATFNWRVVGGSTFSSDYDFSYRLNGQQRPIRRPGRDAGRFYGRSLQAGDVLTLELNSSQAVAVTLSDFHFATPAQAVVERIWYATTPQGQHLTFRQQIELIHPNIDEIRFPDDAEGVEDTAPEATGYPWIAGPSPMILDARVPGYFVGYEDEKAPQRIIRHWWVEDSCSGNVIRSEQHLFLKPSTKKPHWVAIEPWGETVVVHQKGL